MADLYFTCPPAEWQTAPAETLLNIAAFLRRGRRLIPVRGDSPPLCRVALAFERQPAAVKFMALFEEWSLERILRELY